MRRIRFVIPLATILGGCAFAPRVLTLERVTHTQAVAPRPPACVEVRPFHDARPQPRRVGVTRTGFGTEAGEVRTYNSVPGWIARHLADELGAAPACPAGGFVVEGTVVTAFVDEYAHLDGNIVVDLRVRHGDEVVLARRYAGHHEQLSWAASDGEFTDVMHKSLLDLSRRALPEVTAAVGSHCTVPPAGI